MSVFWIRPPRSRVVPERLFGGLGTQVAPDPRSAFVELGGAFDAIFADVSAPWDLQPEDWLRGARRANPEIPVALYEPDGDLRRAVRMVQLGAALYFGCDSTPEEMTAAVAACVRDSRLLRTRPSDPWAAFLVGQSPPMVSISDTIRLIAPRRCTVLITGESGTGKELVARAIHGAGPRRERPLVAVDCGALPEPLLEAELFGHVKGAFTGAVEDRIGRFEQANYGTLFLDEIGDMPLALQAKLLRVIQERELQRVGSSRTLRLDLRIVAATNRDLAGRIEAGQFREDLYYRLNVVQIRIPPLRDRLADLPLLVRHFIARICGEEGIPPKDVYRETLERLARHSWPGNVRELENSVQRAVALSGTRPVLYPGDFHLPLQCPGQAPAQVRLPDYGLDFEGAVTSIERSIIVQALDRTGGHQGQAAQILGLKRSTFAAKLKKIGGQSPQSPIS